jgi:hypothetical protein
MEEVGGISKISVDLGVRLKDILSKSGLVKRRLAAEIRLLKMKQK